MPSLLLRLANALSSGSRTSTPQFVSIPAHQLGDIPKSRASPHAERPPNADNIQHLSHHIPQQLLLYPTLMRILLLVLSGCNPLKRIRALRLIQLHHPPILGRQAPLQRLKLHTNKSATHHKKVEKKKEEKEKEKGQLTNPRLPLLSLRNRILPRPRVPLTPKVISMRPCSWFSSPLIQGIWLAK